MEKSHTNPNSCAIDCAAKVVSVDRSELVKCALFLEYSTVGWNLIEGVIAVTAALLAGSVALLGFGIDSFVECASAVIMIWRLRAEKAHLPAEHLDVVEQRARRLIASALFLLAAYITFDSGYTLWTGGRPEFSLVGVILMALSVAVMLWLARAKRQLAHQLGSKAMEADAFQTTACWWLSLTALIGVGLNGLFGWWWADPAAALVIAAMIVREGREAWRNEKCC